MKKPSPKKIVVPAPANPKDLWTYKDRFRTEAQKLFAGQDGSLANIQSSEGQALVAQAHATTAAALGYDAEAALKGELESSLADHFRWEAQDAARDGRELLSTPSEDYDL